MESKRAKLEEEKEDRISALPDSLIQHILYFLPSTKEAIRTGILSKRWVNQWTRVPALIFNSTSTGMSPENFLKFVDNTLNLHDCSKIKKFNLTYRFRHTKGGRKYPELSSKIGFATRKSVEQIYLDFDDEYEYELPEFLFNNASLVEFITVNCTFMPNGKVNWECLTTLSMVGGRLADQAVELILSGSPVLKFLYFSSCWGFKKLVVVSKSLKVLRLEELRSSFDIEISCPKLEKLELYGRLNVETAKLFDLPSSLCAAINFIFNNHEDERNEIRMSLIKDILYQLRHVKELTIGGWFMECVSAIPVGDQFSPVLNIKCLTLKSHNISWIACLLRNSPVLEELVIDVTLYGHQEYQDFGENYWSDATVFNGLLSHLKTIKIIGFPEGDGKRKVILNFVQFLLKNARVLEKMVVELKDGGTFFQLKVSQELLSLPRCSQYAIIELLLY